jgi:enamine deaminase RidA (YjgF/YER057c/UK114 family)
VQAGNLLFLSGMLPLGEGASAVTGTIGRELDVAAAQDAVRLAVLNGLSIARAHLGRLGAIRRVVRLAVYERTTAEFTEHAKVADAGSELLHRALGPAAEHTRMVFGVVSLPGGMPVEVELVFEVDKTTSPRDRPYATMDSPAGGASSENQQFPTPQE